MSEQDLLARYMIENPGKVATYDRKQPRQTDGMALLAFEHDRLVALAAAGERVPVVLAFDGQHLTTSDIGTTLDRWLDAAVPAERLPVMCSACADLAGFHARGQWHGGSQTRNLTWDGARFARLDFEERLVPGMPLDLVQRYDALQLLLSMTRHLEPLGAGAVLQVLQAYARAGAGRVPDLRPFLQRLLPRLRAVLWLVGWSPRLRGSREARRLLRVRDQKLARLLRQNSDVIERDVRGDLARRGELLAIEASAILTAAIRNAVRLRN